MGELNLVYIPMSRFARNPSIRDPNLTREAWRSLPAEREPTLCTVCEMVSSRNTSWGRSFMNRKPSVGRGGFIMYVCVSGFAPAFFVITRREGRDKARQAKMSMTRADTLTQTSFTPMLFGLFFCLPELFSLYPIDNRGILVL